MNKYAVSTIWKKEIPGGLNIWNSLEVFLAETEKEAVRKHILKKSEEIKEHSLLMEPIVLLVETNILPQGEIEETGNEL